MPKKSKKEEVVTEEEEEEEEEAPPAKQKASKKRKAVAEPEPPHLEEEESPEEDEQEEVAEADPEEVARKAKKRASNRRARQRAVAYRKVAQKVGFAKKGGMHAAAGTDSAFFTISASDAKRLMTYGPHDVTKGSFSKDEAEMRMALAEESIPASALRVTQGRAEALMRSILNESVLRMVESGARKTLDAATVLSVLRPYAAGMSFTAVAPPKGLIKYAQKEGVLSSTQADVEGAEQDEKECKEIAKIAKAQTKRFEQERAQRKAKLQERKAAQAQAQAA
tara:strand:+ start:768 stop:1607 length:840 start_codon:yes stop_codon:yes gene_type:complete